MSQLDKDMQGAVQSEPASDQVNWRTRLLRQFELSAVLRLLGAGVTVAAIGLFLFEGWDDATDLHRYGMILGETLVLTLLGWLTSRWLKEQKSARVFLGLGLVSTTAVFTILGAMIYSQMHVLATTANLPAFAMWTGGSPESVAWLLAVSLLLLGGQALFSFSVLARPVARKLSLMLMLNIALLLMPVRDMGTTALLVLPAVIVGLRQLSLLRRQVPAMRTAEGVAASVLAMLPLLVMVGRSAYLYAEGWVAIGSLALVTYGMLRPIAQSIVSSTALRRVLESMSILPALVTTAAFTRVLGDMGADDRWLILAFAGLLIAFLIDLAKWSIDNRPLFLRGICAVVLGTVVLEQLLWPDITSALIAVSLTTLVALFGYHAREGHVLRLSLLVLLGSGALLVSEIGATLDLGSWVELAALGMGSIVLAAAVERHGTRFAAIVRRTRA